MGFSSATAGTAIARSAAWSLWWIALTAAAGLEAPFRDVAESSGLDFRHWNGRTGAFFFAEMTGGGGALVDYDGDGDLDVFLVQGARLARSPEDTARRPVDAPEPLRDRLYRNDSSWQEEGVRLAFTDVSEAIRLPSFGYGMGVATGDYDNDGWVDLYVTNYGPNVLLHNRGDGTFVDVTAPAGAGDDRWSVAATFVDYDRDGALDLYIGNYVGWSLGNHEPCPGPAGNLDYCGPQAYPPVADRLLRNRGGGSFEDVTQRALRQAQASSGLGVTSGDFDGNGWPDLYVANDLMPNQLWLNQGDGSFLDEAVLGGCAANGQGELEASMGVVSADFDEDGDLDLFMTHLEKQTNTLYLNDGQGYFSDRTANAGLGTPSWNLTGFGVGVLDFDGDGDLDLLSANGAVRTQVEQVRRGDEYPLHQPNQLFENRDGRFVDVSEASGEAVTESKVSRGVATGDVDNDGDTDLLVVNNDGPVRLLSNEVGAARGWLGVIAVAGPGPSRAGFEAALGRPGARRLRRSQTDGSYASASDPRVRFGLDAGPPGDLVVTWPGGDRQRYRNPPAGRYLRLGGPVGGP